MPEFKVTSPDGRSYKVTAPEGATQDEILEQISSFQQDNPLAPKQPPVTEQVGGVLSDVTTKSVKTLEDIATQVPGARGGIGIGETALQMGTGFGATIAGGVTGLGALAASGGDIDAFKDVMGATQQSLTYQPRTEVGKYVSENLGEVFEWAKTKFGLGGEWLGKKFKEQDAKDKLRTGEWTDVQYQEEIDRLDKVGSPLAMTLGEGMFDVFTQVYPTIHLGGVVGGMARSARSARLAKEAELKTLQETIHKAAQEKIEAAGYQEKLYELDAEMVRYPKDYQAPQYGLGGRVAIPEDATRPKAPRATTETMEADLRAAGIASEAPIPFEPPISPAPRGLEITQRGGPTAIFERPGEGRIADMPLETMLAQEHQVMGPPMSMGGGTPVQATRPIGGIDPMSLPYDPVQRLTAIEHMLDPKFKAATEIVAKQEKFMQSIRDQMNELAKSPMGVSSMKRMEALQKKLMRHEETRWQAIDRVNQGIRAAAEAAERKPLPIEKTQDGRQMLRIPGGKQRGAIDKDLLTLGVSKLIRQGKSESTVARKFIGTYRKAALEKAFQEHFHEYGTTRLGWISPKHFHQLARGRLKDYMKENRVTGVSMRSFESLQRDLASEAGEIAERHVSIREGLQKEGLESIPELGFSPNIWLAKDGSLSIRIIDHNGRHRMDVFEQLALDNALIKFDVVTSSAKEAKKFWDTLAAAQKDGRAINIMSEDGTKVLQFNGIARLDKAELFPGKKPLPKWEEGAADVDLLSNIATAGIAGLMKKAIKRNAKPALPPSNNKNIMPSAETVFEAASGETRSLSEFHKSVDPALQGKDIPDTFVNGSLENLSNASFLSHYTSNPYVRYTLDRVGNILRINTLRAKMVKEGIIFGQPGKRRILTTATDPNSPKALWQSLSRREQEQLAVLANEYGGFYRLSRGEIKGFGLSERVASAYESFVNAYEKAVDDINLVRSNDPINKLPGYFAKYRAGDFKLNIVDPVTGETIWSDLFYTKMGRYVMERQLREKFPQYKVEASELKRETSGNPYNVSTVPFEELMDTLRKGDPRVAAIESVVREFKGRRGFGRHAIQRRNISGGELDPSNFYKAFENYIDSAYRYRANAELRKLHGEFQFNMDLQAPNLKKWVGTYLDLASGSFEPGWLARAFHKVADMAIRGVTLGQTGPSAPGAVLRGLNNYFMFKALFGWRPAFLIAQATQPFAFAPQWLAHYQAKGYGKGSISSAIYKGEKELISSLAGKGDSDFANFLANYMVPRGNINPTMIHAMDLLGHGHGKGVGASRWVLGIAPAQGIEMFGRLQAAAYGYQFFKDNGLKGKDLYNMAERFTNDVMVDYARQEQPAWVGKTGMIGQAAGPLSTFATNYWSTTALFLKDALANLDKITAYKPFAIHIAQTAVWAGLTGMLGVKAVDGLLEILKWLGLRDPKALNLTEMIMTNKDIPDWAAFGVVSGTAGMNLGASMAAPEMRMPTTNTMPGVKFLTELATGVWPAIRELSGGKPSTLAERQKLLKTVLPNYLGSMLDLYDIGRGGWMDMEVYSREEGQIVPNVNRRGFGMTRPDEHDRVSRAFGTRSLKEIRELQGVRSAEMMQQNLNSQKTGLIDLAADQLMYGGTGDKSIGSLAADAVKLGMTPGQFVQMVQQTIQNRLTTSAQRQYGTVPSTPSQAQRYELIQDFTKPQKQSGGDMFQGSPLQFADDGRENYLMKSDVKFSRQYKIYKDMLLAEGRRRFPNNEKKAAEWAVQRLQKETEARKIERKHEPKSYKGTI